MRMLAWLIVLLVGTAEAALKNADALIIVTEWQQFRAPDFDLIVKSLSQPVVFDGRNIFDPERLRARGITYYSIGRNQMQGDSAPEIVM